MVLLGDIAFTLECHDWTVSSLLENLGRELINLVQPAPLQQVFANPPRHRLRQGERKRRVRMVWLYRQQRNIFQGVQEHRHRALVVG